MAVRILLVALALRVSVATHPQPVRTADNAGPKWTIGFSNASFEHAWRQVQNREMMLEAEKHPEIELIILDGEGRNDKQIQTVQSLVEQPIDLLIISPRESGALTPVVKDVFEHFAADCRARSVPAAFVYRPELKEFRWLGTAMRQEVLASAASTGLPILDLSACFADVPDKDSLMVMPETAYALKALKREAVDDHPNARGHQLLADELYKQLHTPKGQELLKPRK